MPTPSEPTLPPSPPVEASSSRASFASCPPEDDREREHHAPREERIGSPRPEAGSEGAESEHLNAIQQEPTPEPELQQGLSNDTQEAQVQVRIPQAQEKGEHVEDAGAEEGGTISPSATPDVLAGGENDAATVAQQSTQHAGRSSPALDEPLYLDLPYERDRVSSKGRVPRLLLERLLTCRAVYTANNI